MGKTSDSLGAGPAELTDVAILLNPDDASAVARRPLSAGQVVNGPNGQRFTVAQDIPAGHKVAVRAVEAGDTVMKYGQPIGRASRAIRPGDHVHTHNVEPGGPRAERRQIKATAPVTRYDGPKRTFEGFLRADGRVGTRNYITIISSVNCSASVARYVADECRSLLDAYPNVDGVMAITHKTGCGIAATGENFARLRRTLAGFATHPNVGAAVLIGLGCEVNQVDGVLGPPTVQIGGQSNDDGPTLLTIQQSGGIKKTVAAGVEAVRAVLPRVNAAMRTTQPASKLVLGAECGGSDGSSGITANPAVGNAADRLIAQGGTSVIAETPEIFGAEHLLAERAVSDAVADKLLGFVTWWEEYAEKWGFTLQQNLAVGNYQGGLTTIAEKSLGAIAKAGTTPLTGAYRYAERIDTSGQGFMDSPGYDPVSVTGMVAGGCNLAIFTTGRGSVFGCKPTPCLKIATNTPIYEHMTDDMDINAGTILTGESVERVGERIFEELLVVASGKKTKSEAQGIGDEEFAPWDSGPGF